jgi:hypothetical protein
MEGIIVSNDKSLKFFKRENSAARFWKSMKWEKVLIGKLGT